MTPQYKRQNRYTKRDFDIKERKKPNAEQRIPADFGESSNTRLDTPKTLGIRMW